MKNGVMKAHVRSAAKWMVLGAFAAGLGGCGMTVVSQSFDVLCKLCTDDKECGGNPCFADVSGNRYCGHPCGSCPTGYMCQSVTGTSQTVVSTCFPNDEICAPMSPKDMAMSVSHDMATNHPVDMAMTGPPPDMAQQIPVGGPVGITGGTVDRLFFGFTGDTRPADDGQPYPQAIINNIFTEMGKKGVQFAVDQGDHMFAYTGKFANSAAQMANYVSAANLLKKTVFMTMGNHECSTGDPKLCSLTTSDGYDYNYTSYMNVLRTQGLSLPYYRFDVMTNQGLAVFIVVADNVWDGTGGTEATWLETQLTDADKNAKYTFVSKHHPFKNTDNAAFPEIYAAITKHKYTLLLTGHSHLYKRQPTDRRAIVVGCGGAPLAGGAFWGYGTALQNADGTISVNVYDQATGNVEDSFSVTPQ